MTEKESLAFGWHPVLEALSSGKDLQKVLLQQGIRNERSTELMRLCKERGVPVQYVPILKLDKITRKNHQGIIAFLSPVEYADIDNLLAMVFASGETPAILVLDGVDDVRNFGAICRSAECFGFHGVLIPTKGSAPISEDAIKTSSGALLRLPVCRTTNLTATLRSLQASGLALVGMTEKTDNLLMNVKHEGPLAIVMGNEELGLSPDTLRICDHLAKIPMTGKIASLNVSVSAGIAMYHFFGSRLA